MKAIKTKVDFSSGKRAGGINPRSGKTLCAPEWQYVPENPDEEEGWEIRLVLDESILTEEVLSDPDVTLIEADDEETLASLIEAEVDTIPEVISYSVTNESLVAEAVRQKGLDLSQAMDANGNPLQGRDLAEWLHDNKVVGVEKKSSKDRRSKKATDRKKRVERQIVGLRAISEQRRNDNFTRHTPRGRGRG